MKCDVNRGVGLNNFCNSSYSFSSIYSNFLGTCLLWVLRLVFFFLRVCFLCTNKELNSNLLIVKNYKVAYLLGSATCAYVLCGCRRARALKPQGCSFFPPSYPSWSSPMCWAAPSACPHRRGALVHKECCQTTRTGCSLALVSPSPTRRSPGLCLQRPRKGSRRLPPGSNAWAPTEKTNVYEHTVNNVNITSLWNICLKASQTHIFTSVQFFIFQCFRVDKKQILIIICCAVLVSGACTFQKICDHSQRWLKLTRVAVPQ